MRWLETWVTTPLAQAVGWTLLHSLWEGALIATALALALWTGRSPRVRYALACVAILLMLGGFGFTLVRMMPQGVRGLGTAQAPVLPVWNVQPGPAAHRPRFPDLVAVVPWLAPFWIAGVWIFALGQVGGWISVRRLRRRGVCAAPERWQKELARLSGRLRVSRPILLLESCLAQVPMVVGHIRPVILMPIGLLAGLPSGQIEAILLHELAHIRRHDYLVNALQRALECLLFYHPAVWWISRVMRAERENCCDDVVVATRGKVQEYAEALATLEQNRWLGREATVAARGGNIVTRIRRLLYPNAAHNAWTAVFAAGIVITTAMVALAAWPAAPSPQSSPAAPRQGEAAPAPAAARLKPLPTRPLARIRVSADSRKVFEALAAIANLNVAFTADFEGRRMDVDLKDMKLEDMLQVACQMTKSFWVPVASDTILVVPDTPQNRQKYGNRAATLPASASSPAAPPQQSSPAAPPVVKRPEASPYDRWLSEEVPYIITAEERTEFQKLKTDEERNRFIEQFWERRDPNPGSPENEFKKEYYRRIAYANKHWATDRPGWKADRGRIYILYGPPEEVDSSPAGRPYPFEEWKYNHIQGLGDNVIFRFEDRKRTGEYPLAPGSPVKK